jgi:fructose-specific phosphotransferase system component IIB
VTAEVGAKKVLTSVKIDEADLIRITADMKVEDDVDMDKETGGAKKKKLMDDYEEEDKEIDEEDPEDEDNDFKHPKDGDQGRKRGR